jgi:hypothetical protein
LDVDHQICQLHARRYRWFRRNLHALKARIHETWFGSCMKSRPDWLIFLRMVIGNSLNYGTNHLT